MAYIVLIDDNRRLLRALTRALERAGQTVAAYEDGSVAIADLSHVVPDLLVTDIFMPTMDGLETIRQARAISPSLPIIAISGGAIAGPDYLITARHFGANASLTKPFRPAALVALARQLLQSVAR
jgi:two-component system chemotaxis response regulator CheY